MELGQRIKEARLEKGLSQRELCGDMITRNMLSLIENGNAQPSMDTLRYLAYQLEKPMSYFLEEACVSPNQACILAARSAPAAQAMEILKDYRAPDPIFDPEYHLLRALSAMALAETAIEENRLPLARELLSHALDAGNATIYYTRDLERRRLLLCHRAKTASPAILAASLPDHREEILLRAEAALEEMDYPRCAALLDSLQERDERWHFLRGEACMKQKQYAQAAHHYLETGKQDHLVFSRLEICYRELGDFEKAYFYARKQFPG